MFDLINHLNITSIMITTFNLVNHDKNIKTYRVGTLNRANHDKYIKTYRVGTLNRANHKKDNVKEQMKKQIFFLG